MSVRVMQRPVIAHARWRARLVLGLLLLTFALLIARAVYLQGMHNDFLQQKGESRYSRVLEMPATRGMITDRNRDPLAISTPVESVWVTPSALDLSAENIQPLARLLEMSPTELAKKLADPQRDFVYLKRHLPPEDAAKVMALGVPGISLQREYRRYYPGGELFSHLVGFTDVDDKGQEGLELALESEIAGKPGSRRVIRDRRGYIIEDVESIRKPQDGRDTVLSIDARIQNIAFRELKNAVSQHQAKAGGVVVLDALTGEILALANLPTYNPNNRVNLDPKRMRNRAVTDLFEPGSTLKPFTAATALEAGLFRPDTVIQTGNGTLNIGPATIHDAHPAGALTVSQVIQKSSNVGAAKMALALPSVKMWEMFAGVGFGALPNAGFPGEAKGRLRPHAGWKPIEQATMSYGHGISVSLLQLAHAYMVFASDGEIRPLSLFRREGQAEATRVMSAVTAQQVRKMLELAVLPGGTAPKAQVAGYRVGGKTGTAHKLDGASYAANKYVGSFVGLAPASSPRLIVAVMIDEPTTGGYYGGVVAAPAFSNVMAGALRLLGVKQDAPLNNVILPPPSAPEIREEV